jgi:aldehyde dehydrogenase (NAD+)
LNATPLCRSKASLRVLLATQKKMIAQATKDPGTMLKTGQFYINGQWVDPLGQARLDVINPATEEAFASIAMGNAADVDRAVKAAAKAFPAFAATTKAQRIDLLQAIMAAMAPRLDEIAATMTLEMGAPKAFSRDVQAQSGYDHFATMMPVLRDFHFDEQLGTSMVTREPIGVCGFITPWNWPINQIACKVAPALAAGCTMVLKPSELTPLSALIFAEVLHEAGVPAGVFNLINGDGPTVGAALSGHPLIDMMSFTGSTRAGIEVAKRAAETVKRVAQELGGNSPNVILDDADLEAAVTHGVTYCFSNSGQSCNSPQRMLVPQAKMEAAKAIAKRVALTQRTGDPTDPEIQLGPVVSEAHFGKIQDLIALAIQDGASLVTGGLGRPEGLNRGYYVRPTVLGDVTPQMSIHGKEIFGPVIMLIGYRDEEDAIAIANDTEFGLAACVYGGTLDGARRVARRIRAGNIELNGVMGDYFAPFGGYKQSGNGREYGVYGLHEFLETKAMIGYGAA